MDSTRKLRTRGKGVSKIRKNYRRRLGWSLSARLLSFDVEGGGGVASLAIANAQGVIHKLGG